MPVLNEERHLRAAVQGVLSQAYPGEMELILSIGPSDDATAEVAAELALEDSRVRMVENPTGHTPAALNVGIDHATHEIILRVDGHGELCENYITTAVTRLTETGAANVGGLMDARGQTSFEQAVAAAYNSRFGLGGGGFHLADTPAGPAPTVFLGCFRKDALLAVGGFDEAMHRAQDWELNYRLRGAGYEVWFTPELRVTYRPRSTLTALSRQFFKTGQWRREVIRRYPETASPRYLAAPVAVTGLGAGILGGLLGVVLRHRLLSAMLVAPLLYLAFLATASTMIREVGPTGRARLPLVLATMHVSWGLGFLFGVPASQRRSGDETR